MKLLLKKIARLTFLNLTLFTLFSIFPSCQNKDRQVSYKAQILVNEADALTQTREFEQALKKSQEAEKKLLPLIKDKTNIGPILTYCRAQLTSFMAENTLIIEKGNLDPQSLIPMPSKKDYIHYNETVETSLALLGQLDSKKMNSDQQAAYHSLLASFYRLDVSMLTTSSQQYLLAIESTKKWLDEKRANPKAINVSESLIQTQLSNLSLSLIEVYLASHRWAQALSQLEALCAGPDIKYFEVNIPMTQQSLEELQHTKWQTNYQKNSSNAAEKLKTSMEKLNEQSGKTPLPSALDEQIASKIWTLNFLQNQLIYRTICYYHLNKKEPLNAARQILRDYLPSVEETLMRKLENHNNQ